MYSLIVTGILILQQCAGGSSIDDAACATALAGDSQAHAFLSRKKSALETVAAFQVTSVYLTLVAPTSTPIPTETSTPTPTSNPSTTPDPTVTPTVTATPTLNPTVIPVAAVSSNSNIVLFISLGLAALAFIVGWPYIRRYMHW